MVIYMSILNDVTFVCRVTSLEVKILSNLIAFESQHII